MGLLAEARRKVALELPADHKGSHKVLVAVPFHREKACLQVGRKEAWDTHPGAGPYHKGSPYH